MFSWEKRLNFHEPQTCEIKIEKCHIFEIFIATEFLGTHFVMNACTMSANVLYSILISGPHTLG